MIDRILEAAKLSWDYSSEWTHPWGLQQVQKPDLPFVLSPSRQTKVVATGSWSGCNTVSRKPSCVSSGQLDDQSLQPPGQLLCHPLLAVAASSRYCFCPRCRVPHKNQHSYLHIRPQMMDWRRPVWRGDYERSAFRQAFSNKSVMVWQVLVHTITMGHCSQSQIIIAFRETGQRTMHW